MTPGWYPDPQGAPVARWWGGAYWTPFTADPARQQALEYQRRAAHNTTTIKRVLLAVVGIPAAVFLAVVLVSLVIALVTVHG